MTTESPKEEKQSSCNNKEQNIAYMKKGLLELEKESRESPKIYWCLLRNWLISITFIITGVLVSFFIIAPLVPPATNNLNFQNIANSFIAPSITINGLFITFVPVISFFLINQIKEQNKERKEEFAEEEKRSHYKDCENCETKEISRQTNKIVQVFYQNYIISVLRYTETYVTVAIISLIFIPVLFFVFSSRNFIFLDLLLLNSLATGVFPIVSIAFHKQPIKMDVKKL